MSMASRSTISKTSALGLVSLFLRICPWEGARWRIVPWALKKARNASPASGYQTVRTRYGFHFRANLNDWLGQHVFVTGEYEPPTGNLMRKLLKPGDTMIDIGANAGYFTLLAARRVGPTGYVFAFEPVPETGRQLKENIRINKASNCRIYHEALCDKSDQILTFYEGPVDHRGISSIRPLEDASAVIEVKASQLDDKADQIGKVDLIKIDVEGAELLALMGMTKILDRDQPDLIIEVTNDFLKALGHSAELLCRFLTDRGYRMYRIGHRGLEPVEVSGQCNLSGQFNALFTCREELPQSLELRRTGYGG